MKGPVILCWTRAISRLAVLAGASTLAGLALLVRRARGPVTIAERAHWLHESCCSALRRLGIEIIGDGRFPSRGLLVSNHLSYLDILVLSACSPAVFVAKKEVRTWALFGWLARLAGTVFVDRNHVASAYQANLSMARALSQGQVVVLFPEGTSSDGASVLPFHAALFESAVTTGEPVSTAHISYTVEDGSAANEICYWGTMRFFPHLLRLISLRGVRAQIRFSAEAQKFADRKLAARATRERVLTLGKPSRLRDSVETLRQ